MLPDISIEAINDNLAVIGISSVDEEYIEAVKEELGAFPDGFRPWDKKHTSSVKWLNSQKICSMAHPTKYVQIIKDTILAKPRDREKLERLLLSRAGPKETCFRLEKIDVYVPDETIRMYTHYFWNIDIMGASDWATYFAKDDSTRLDSISGGYKISLSCGKEATFLRMGINTILDGKQIMLDVQRELYTTFLETKSLPLSYKKVEMLSSLSRSLAKIDERVQAGDSALHDTLKKFEKFKILSPVSSPPPIEALVSKGSVTGRNRRGENGRQ
jgi:hypothetical protein